MLLLNLLSNDSLCKEAGLDSSSSFTVNATESTHLGCIGITLLKCIKSLSRNLSQKLGNSLLFTQSSLLGLADLTFTK